MEEEGHVYFIAYEGDEPCGYVSVQQQEENVFHLQKIYVLPHFQGAHCGSFLFREAVRYIKEVHPEPCLMELNVNRNNKALLFYERMGMRKLREGDFKVTIYKMPRNRLLLNQCSGAFVYLLPSGLISLRVPAISA